MAAEDYRRLHRLTAPQLLTSCANRLAQLGIAPAEADRAVDAIARALLDGPATRAALAEEVARVGVAVAGQAMPHLLFLASARGLVVRGPTRGREQAYVLVDDWIPADAAPPDRERDLAWLAHRYLRGHGPATEADLARWAKLPLRDVRAGLRSIADMLVDLGDGLVDRSGRGSTPGFPPPRLLGQWDAVLCGWVSRDDILGELGHGIVTDNGLFRPFAMVDGRAVAIWRYNAGRVTIDPLQPLPDDVAAALDADARAVERFFVGG